MKLTCALTQLAFLAIGALVGGADASACMAPPQESTSNSSTLVRMAKYIVLAEAKSTLGGGGYVDTEFVFETKEVLKGDAPKQFRFHGHQRESTDDSLADFDAHKNPEFWAHPTAGNSTITTWCGVFGIFEIGETYLIINSDVGHFKAYENIRSDDDLWLKVVRLLVERHPD